MIVSVCPSVCLQSAIPVSRALMVHDIEICFAQHDRTICLQFLETKFRNPKFKGFTPNDCVKERHPYG